MSYAEQARARGWVRRSIGYDEYSWFDGDARVFVGANETWEWYQRGWHLADSEEDALRHALEAWPEVNRG